MLMSVVYVRTCGRRSADRSAGGGVGEGVEEVVGGGLGPVGVDLAGGGGGGSSQALAGRADGQRRGRQLHVERRRRGRGPPPATWRAAQIGRANGL